MVCGSIYVCMAAMTNSYCIVKSLSKRRTVKYRSSNDAGTSFASVRLQRKLSAAPMRKKSCFFNRFFSGVVILENTTPLLRGNID